MLWELPEVQRILSRQLSDGRWRYSGGDPAVRSAAGYDQLESYRQLGVLICKFGLDRRHPAVGRAADFLHSFQTDAGDYRGIYGNQYSPNYTAAITELLILGGYGFSSQVRAALEWLLSIRQDDGGWAIPARTLPAVAKGHAERPGDPRTGSISPFVPTWLPASSARPRGPSQVPPFGGHTPRGRVAQGASVHPRHLSRPRQPLVLAGLSYPFWWTDLLSALDSLARSGLAADDPDVSREISWFIDNQHPNGLWNPGRNRPKGHNSDRWVALAICRLLRRCLGTSSIRSGREH